MPWEATGGHIPSPRPCRPWASLSCSSKAPDRMPHGNSNGSRLRSVLPHPLGATWDGRGVNFALFSAHAERVELCLFDEAGQQTRLAVEQQTAFVWHVYVPNLSWGQRYG